MTTLQKIYQILQLKDNKKDFDYHFIKPTRPEEGHPFYFNPFNIPHVRSEKCTKERLSKVLAFIDMKKQSRYSDGFTVMHIATVNKRLLSMCGTQKSVSNLITYMIKIGLLADYDESYQFNGYYKRNNKCKSYVYSYDTEQQIKQYCTDNNINKYKINNTTIVEKFNDNIKSFETSEVRFSSKLHLMKPDNFSKNDFEKYLTNCLYENYPHFQQYQELADYINETYYYDDMDRQIQFKPHFTWTRGDKAVRKIGIRATNSLVSCKKEVEKDDHENILYRKEVLERYNLSHEFDVKSSVPRVTYLLNNGFWVDNNIDLYKMMYDNFIVKYPYEKTDWTKETREIFKSFHMRGYFDTYGKVAAHIKLAISKKTKYNKDDWSNLDYVMKSYKEAIEQTIGTLKYDSEIFFHESCIYLDVLNNLLKRGFNVLQIYDGFYTDSYCNDIEDLVKQLSESYYSKNIFNKHIKYKLINNSNTNYKSISNKSTNTTINNYQSINSSIITIVEKFNTDIEQQIKYKLINNNNTNSKSISNKSTIDISTNTINNYQSINSSIITIVEKFNTDIEQQKKHIENTIESKFDRELKGFFSDLQSIQTENNDDSTGIVQTVDEHRQYISHLADLALDLI